MEVVELVEGRDRLGDLVGRDRHEVLVVDLLLPVGEILERLERPIELRTGQREAELLEPRREGGPPGVLAQDELVRRAADVLGPHDLVGELLLQDPVLMDSGLVGERVLADDGLVRLHVHARDVGEQARCLEDLLGPDTRVDPEVVLPRPERHHDLLEGRVARPLADPVDRALHLPGALHDRGQRVRHRLPEVVVAVDGEDDPVQPLDLLADAGDPLAPLAWNGVPDGVRDVDRLSTGLDRRRQDVAHVVEVGSRGVLRRELHVFAVRAGVADGVDRRLEHLGPGLAQLVLQVDVGGRDERVDSRLPGVLHGLPAAVDVAEPHAGQAADGRRVLQRPDLLGHLAGGFEVLVRRDREAGLDDVDLQAGQLAGHLELLHRVHGEARRLLAVPQCRVEDDDAIHTSS